MKLKFSLMLCTLFTSSLFAQESWTTGQYENNTNISKVLQIPSATSLKVTITGETEVKYDFFSIYDSNAKLIKILDGVIYDTFEVEGNSITAKLTSDYSVTKKGVEISIEAITGSTTTEYTGKEDTWSTGAYLNNTRKTRILEVDGSDANTLYEVSINGETEARYDFFYIKNAEGVILKKLSGIINETFQVKGSSVIAELTSDYSITKQGVSVVIKELKQISDKGIGTLTTVAGQFSSGYSGDGGLATEAYLSDPVGVDVDSNGNIYIADLLNSVVRKVDSHGIITTVGEGFIYPHALTVAQDGSVYVCSTNGNQIKKITTSGETVLIAGNGNRGFDGDEASAINASLNGPHAITTDALGQIWFADTFNNAIRYIDNNSIIHTITMTNITLDNPMGLVIDNNILYVSDSGNNRIIKHNLQTNSTQEINSEDGLSFPTKLMINDNKDLIVSDTNHYSIIKLDMQNDSIQVKPSTVIVGLAQYGFTSFIYIGDFVIDKEGNILIADPQKHTIRKITY